MQFVCGKQLQVLGQSFLYARFAMLYYQLHIFNKFFRGQSLHHGGISRKLNIFLQSFVSELEHDQAGTVYIISKIPGAYFRGGGTYRSHFSLL